MKNSKSNRNYPINLRNKRNYSNNIFDNNKRNKSFQERLNNDLDNETKTIPGNLFYNKNIGISASNQQIQQKQNINNYNLFHKTLLKNMNLKSPSKNIILNKFKNNNQMNSISLLSQKIIKEDTKEKNDKIDFNIEINNNLNNSKNNKCQIENENNENKKENENYKIELKYPDDNDNNFKEDEFKDKNKINFNINNFLKKNNIINSKNHDTLIKNISDHKRPYNQRLHHKRSKIINKLNNNNKNNFLKFNLKDIDINLKNKEELEDEKEPKDENHKYEENKESKENKENKERENEQLGYIKNISQMENIFPKNIKQNNISLSSHKIIKNNIIEKNDKLEYNIEINNNLNNSKNNKCQIE